MIVAENRGVKYDYCEKYDEAKKETEENKGSPK